MYFAAYPNSEVITPYAYLYHLNEALKGSYHYAAEANVIPNSALYASNNTLVPETTTMRLQTETNMANGHFNFQSDNFQQASWSCPGQFATVQGLDKYFDASSKTRINSITADCHGGPVSVLDKYSESSSLAGINSRNVDCHGRPVSVLDIYSETSSQTGINSRNVDCHGGPVNGSKSSEIWRPFCLSPTKELSVNRSEMNQQNIPYRMKIEHSKTSLFKPVKKRDYKCRYCTSNFTSSAQLNSHLRVHTGSKPFLCSHPACRKRFARNEELTRHLRIHSGYKPHACRSCGKTFGRKDHLAKHAKTHLHASEKRAYACAVPGCGHRYTRSDALTRHRTSAHATYRREGELMIELKKNTLIS